MLRKSLSGCLPGFLQELAANEVNLLSDLLMVFMTKEPMNTALAIDKERDKEAVCKLFIPQLQSSKTVFVLAAWDTELDKVTTKQPHKASFPEGRMSDRSHLSA